MDSSNAFIGTRCVVIGTPRIRSDQFEGFGPLIDVVLQYGRPHQQSRSTYRYGHKAARRVIKPSIAIKVLQWQSVTGISEIGVGLPLKNSAARAEQGQRNILASSPADGKGRIRRGFVHRDVVNGEQPIVIPSSGGVIRPVNLEYASRAIIQDGRNAAVARRQNIARAR